MFRVKNSVVPDQIVSDADLYLQSFLKRITPGSAVQGLMQNGEKMLFFILKRVLF